MMIEIKGLADHFIAAIEILFTRIAHNPKQFATVRPDLHRAMSERFPYALYFRIEPDCVYVIACAHTRRDPVRWERRT